MKIPVIKSLVETQTLASLKAAENALLEGEIPAIEIGGDDEGEQLTHALAAIFILHEMEREQIAFTAALRLYTQKVRTSIN